ncbi:SUN domain-containing 1 isoform X12 [Pelobates cultripes]|uniref:SUN domain-containing 1 isoform X12 n=1 Tax=Pelobates cultripes TaxID=61616 RepID=A0AAD1SPK9_PELCU|nr:SUN domain-containing 1 isoform X12 [Pelobates cultripes]
MDYSHLHTYAPPQCLPENTGYTYALSSSYSSAALDFETFHKLDPVFDSPRMSRRSLRLLTTGHASDLHNDSIASNASYSGSISSEGTFKRSLKQQHIHSRQSSSGSHHSAQRKSGSNSSFLSQSSFSTGGGGGDTTAMSSILDESLIREQTEVDHLWGLDDDDPKAGETTVIQANGDLNSAQTQTTMINYTCNDCSILSDRNDVLTAYPTSHAKSANKHTASTVYSRDRSQKQKSRYFLQQAVRSVAASGWFVSRKALSFLWLAIVSPGRAASGMFWWLGTGWYQLATLISLLNVFVLTRCLPKIKKLLPLLLLLLLLLGLWYWNFIDLWSLLPAFGGVRMHAGQTAEDTVTNFKPASDIDVPSHGKPEMDLQFVNKMKEFENRLALMAANHSHHVKDHDTLVHLVQNIQEQVAKMGDQSQISLLITAILNERLAKMTTEQKDQSTGDSNLMNTDYEARLVHLETLLGKLSEAIEEDRKLRTSSGGDNQDVLRSKIQSLEQEFVVYKAELLKEKTARTNCEHADCVLEKVDAKVRESLHMMFTSQENLPESFKQWLSANYLSKDDFNNVLRQLELRILKNITHHVSITKQVPSAAMVEQAVTGGISGITEEDARVIVKNALKLYSQDRTGMVDYALESGGGSILGTRCSETYGTKTALLSLFGIPLWYFSQSPRVVIQPDMYPGNCWAFKGAQGYLVVRLSMKIYPTSFSLEHIPRSLSPTGNITSAPKDFAVYGLEDEYQENGTLLVHSMYDQEGEPLQMFKLTEENEKSFQIVELRIYSNWGHTDYTCLYRFRAHGTPVK